MSTASSHRRMSSRQRAADACDRARRILCAPTPGRAPSPAGSPATDMRSGSSRRSALRFHLRRCRLQRPPVSPASTPDRAHSTADAAQRDGGAVRRRLPVCISRSLACARSGAISASPRPAVYPARCAGDPRRRQLRYLDGGGDGCFNADERPTDRRKLYHHLTFYGFLLCFAATCRRTLYHYLLAREAPYAWWDLPVVLGTLGGIGLVIGPIGLLAEKAARSGARRLAALGMDIAFLAMLLLTAYRAGAAVLARHGRDGLLLAFISAWCSRCSSPCPTASSCTAFIASPRWCATHASGR